MTADHVLAGTGARSLLTAPAAVRRLAVDRVRAAVQERKTRHADRLVVMFGLAEGWYGIVRAWRAMPYCILSLQPCAIDLQVPALPEHPEPPA